jgi:hypothetical protein
VPLPPLPVPEDGQHTRTLIRARDLPKQQPSVGIDAPEEGSCGTEHSAGGGGALLVAAARRLQGCLRPTDTAARLVGEVVHALETSRLSPRQLTLEITESVLVADIETMSARLRELKGQPWPTRSSS